VDEAADLVDALILKILDGKLDWDLPEHAADDDVIAYLCTKLYGRCSSLRRRAARTLSDEALDQRADEAPDAFERLSAEREIAYLARAFAEDAEALAYIGQMSLGKARAEIAEALGWTVQRAKVVRNRIRRTVEARGAAMNDNGEAGPPSSGPRGDLDETQATEERRGAAPERHRRAGGAGGRRR
jgi:hypothetical protein